MNVRARRRATHQEFAVRDVPGGPWLPFDAEMNVQITRLLEEWSGLPGTVVVRDSSGRAHWLGHEARDVLRLAVRVLDAGLRPDVGYRHDAMERYLGLATAMTAGMAELRTALEITQGRNGSPGREAVHEP